MKLVNALMVLVVLTVLLWQVGLASRRPVVVAPPPIDLSLTNPINRVVLEDALEQLDPESAASWQGLAHRLIALGYLAQAEACYAHARTLAPEDGSLAYRHGQALARIGRVPEAIQAMKDALEYVEPGGRTPIQAAIGQLWLRLENMDEALRAFNEVADHPPVVVELARIALREGRPADAKTVLDPLLERMPRERYPLRFAVAAAEALGDPLEAARLRNRCERSELTENLFVKARSNVRLTGEMTTWRMEAMGRQAIEEGRVDEGLDLLERRLEAEWSPTAAELVAVTRIGRGELDQASAMIERMGVNDGENFAVLMLRGDLAFARGEIEPAGAFYDRSFTMNDTAAAARRAHRVWTRLGDSEQADRWMALALRTDGIEQFRDNELNAAMQALTRSIALRADDPLTWYYISECAMAEDNLEASLDAAWRAVESDPHFGRGLRRIELLESHGIVRPNADDAP